MNVLLFKRDLDHFSDRDILALANMYDLSGDVNDLKWLIAINHSQKAQMLPLGGLEHSLILENLDDDALVNMCQIKGYDDLCEQEYHRRLIDRYPDSKIQGTARDTFIRVKRLGSLLEWLRGLGGNYFLDDLENTKELYLNGKEISVIPKSIKELQKLEILNLSNNIISELLPTIDELKNLRDLNLNRNRLRKIPDFIGDFKNLEYLYLLNNQISKLPDSIGELSSLQGLYLGGNQLQSLPETIGNLSNLQWLYLSDNQLQSLPESIGDLKNLKRLDLRNNQIHALDIQKLQEKLPNTKIESTFFYRI